MTVKRTPRREYALAVVALSNAKHRLTEAQDNLYYAKRRVAKALNACNEAAAARQKP